MVVPVLTGVVDRRVLVNYRVDPVVAAAALPAPFRPHLVNGHAVAGICLLRLTRMRPQGLPAFLGLTSENAAHRIAVEWDTEQGTETGVYIPRRDSDSLVNVAVGGRLYPGRHHPAHFEVVETGDAIGIGFTARDASASVSAEIRLTTELRGSGLFADTGAASRFFQAGSTGFSRTGQPHRFDGLQLRTSSWRIEPAEIVSVRSSFFDDLSTFPAGSAQLDSALVMRKVPVSWHALPPLLATATLATV